VQLNPYLTFNGQCEAAFKFYELCLGGKIDFMLTYRNSPMADKFPPEWGDKILHSTLTVDGNVLQGADSPPGQEGEMKGVSLALGIDEPADAERIFNALAEKGTVTMPLQQTFWAVRFGTLVDQFGVPWMISCGNQ
jgi:PhnB protein